MNVSFAWASFLIGLSGFIALSFEILWTRFYSYASGSSGQAFGVMLGCYLLGLALGAVGSRHWLQKRTNQKSSLSVLGRLFAVSNLMAFLVIPIAARLVTDCAPFARLPLRTLPLVMIAATCFGSLLPLLCHYTIPPDHRAGARTSWLYLASIVGSGAGSLLTGLVLMDLLPLRHIAAALLVMGLVLSLGLAWLARTARWFDGILWIALTLTSCATSHLHHDLYGRLFHRGAYRSAAPFQQVVETRHGVITVDNERRVYGGGVYDGVIDTRLRANTGLIRPYFISALHPKPREVLVIGVSGGAWTQILAHHPDVETVTAVELSPGYLEIIRNYPEVSGVLTNAKVSMVIDDGRRWLLRHPQRKFDVIAMNTTYHWRELSSALLSREFLQIVREHLKPGGLVMWNCTGSDRALKTGLEVFPHTIMVMNNCVGSLTPLLPDRERWRSVLSRYRIDGQPLFDLSTPDGSRRLEAVLAFLDNRSAAPGGWRWRDRKAMERLFGRAKVITDDNLGHEYQSSFGELFDLRIWP